MKVALAIPIVGSVPGEVYHTHLGLARDIAHITRDMIVLRCLDTFPHDRARQYLIEQSLEYDCDLMLFLDSDIEYVSDMFTPALAAMRATGAAMVSGYYYQRGFPFASVWSKKHTDPNGREAFMTVFADKPEPDQDPCVEIDACGLGFALVDLSFIREKYPSGKDLFHMFPRYDGSGDAGAIWEDGYFCNRIRTAGGKIIGHAGLRVRHLAEKLPVGDDNVKMLRAQQAKDAL